MVLVPVCLVEPDAFVPGYTTFAERCPEASYGVCFDMDHVLSCLGVDLDCFCLSSTLIRSTGWAGGQRSEDILASNFYLQGHLEPTNSCLWRLVGSSSVKSWLTTRLRSFSSPSASKLLSQLRPDTNRVSSCRTHRLLQPHPSLHSALPLMLMTPRPRIAL